jgi:putative ABC transport system substrate-binding protein
MRRREFIAALSGAAAWPVVAHAQQRPLPVVGVFNTYPAEPDLSWRAAAFRQGIGEQGYVDGRDVEILYRYAEKSDSLPELAAEFVRRRVAVVFTVTTPAALAIKKATATIPIVFSSAADPVQAGLVASLNRPGGNVTGVTYLVADLAAKRLELLREVVPAAKSIGYLYDPNNSAVEDPSITALETAAATLGLRLVTAKATDAGEIERAFAVLVEEGIGALLAGNLVRFTSQIIALAAHDALPTMYPYRNIVEAGGLISYGGDTVGSYHLAGTYVGRILKGAKPSDLPIQQSTRVELAINLKTAKALGLTIPLPLLVRADEVIE